MTTTPRVASVSNSRMVTVYASSTYRTPTLVERYGYDETGRRRPMMIVRTGAATQRRNGIMRAA